VRGTPKLDAGTSEQWQEWKTDSKQKSKIRHWIAEELLDSIQNTIMFPVDVYREIRSYIRNRWIDKPHALTADPQDIKPGNWCDLAVRFLPCMFNELQKFVECEQAMMLVMYDKEAARKYNAPKRLRGWRSREAGLAHLEWASELRYDDEWDESTGVRGKLTPQAKAAREIKKLYLWWVDVYRNRPDPMDASGWSDYCDMRREKGYGFLEEDKTPEEKEIGKIALDKTREIEEAYQKEDEQMMIRLIKVRDQLWS
jgi:hypothetical protein